MQGFVSYISRRASCLSRARLALIFIVLLLAASLGCAQPQTSLPEAAASPAAQTAPAASLPLPAPSQLPRQLSQASQGSLLGSHFAAELPYNRVTVAGDSALFEPAGGNQLDDAAYASYCLSMLAPDAAYPSLDLGWTAAERPLAGCWLALANWQSNRWDWHYLPPYDYPPYSNLSLLDLAPYLQVDAGIGYLYAIVLVNTVPPARLMWLHLGNHYPDGGYIATRAANPPRSLELELIPSPDDGNITNVDWDFESDGTIDAHNVFTTIHTYAESGVYNITAYLTDVDGTLRIAEKSVPVSPWSIAPQPFDPVWGSADAVIDGNGVVHLAFLRDPDSDGQPPYDLLYTANPGGIWSEEPVCQVNLVNQPVLAEAGGQKHILLLDDPGTEREVIVHAWREGEGWQHAQLVDGDFAAHWRPDLALDSSGAVHVAYFADGPSGPNSLRYASSATGFSFADVPLPAEPWRGMALAVDEADLPHLVTTVQLGWQLISCAYAYWDGTQWDAELVGEPAYDCTAYDILFDAQQQPNLLYLSMVDSSGVQPSCPLRLCVKPAGSWLFADLNSIDNLTVAEDTNARLALDTGGQTMLAVGKPNGWDFGLDAVTWFIHHDGVTWRSEVLENQGSGGTLYGFGLDPLGRPWLCYDGESLRLATRME